MTHWYQVSKKRPRVEQFVLEFSPGRYDLDTRMLLLTATYLRMYQNPWIATLLKLDSDDHSSLLVKTQESASALSKARNIRLAFSLYKYDSGNLFGIHVGFDVSPPVGCPFPNFTLFEEIVGIDYVEQQERIRRSLIGMDRLSIWLAEGGEAETDYDSDIMTATGMDVRYETQLDVPSEFRSQLVQAYDTHIEEHNHIPESKRDYQQSVRWLTGELPTTEHPIFSDSSEKGRGIESAASNGFWKRIFGRSS